MKLKLIKYDNYLKEIWDFLIIILTIFIAIEFPLKLAYGYSFTNYYFEIIVTLVLLIDIIVSFNTEIYSKGKIIKNKKQIARIYLHRSFILDVFATIPFYLISVIFPELIWLKWLGLTRLFKLLRINTLVSKWRNRQTINPGVLRLVIFFFWIFLLAHWIACMWIFIARIEKVIETPTYIDAIYWCITTITTVGYGDISPITDLQKIWTMLSMILGVGIYAYVIANIASLISNIDLAKSNFFKKMENINSFLSYKSVPKRLKQNVQDYYQFIWNNRMAQSEFEILSDLPTSLKSEISLHLNKKIIEHVPFFKNTDKKFVLLQFDQRSW